VDKQNVLIGGRVGFEEVGGVGDARRNQVITDALVFFGREDVLAMGR
jgi:hypothetical protein